MCSYTFTLSAQDSILSSKLYPPIILPEEKQYVLGLIDFVTFNTIPNVDKTNNKFHIGTQIIEIPEGAYEISDIENSIKTQLHEMDEKKNVITKGGGGGGSLPNNREDLKNVFLKMKSNLNTLRFEITCNEIIHFEKPNSIAKLLGFKKRKLAENKKHISDFPINISKVNAICIECNLITNSYNNSNTAHLLHMFYPTVASGYRIIEKVTNVIYLPINSKHIDEIILKIVDQDGNFINFQKETITVRLHLKELI